jgi:hypothetical protein
MKRRTVLKQMLYVTGGVLVLPSCLHNKSKASLLLKNISVDGDEEKIMAELCETIIPATDTPGAKDLSAHLFALMMVDDCYKKDDQQKFIRGLKAFEEKSKKAYNKSFATSSPAEKATLLNELEAGKDSKDDLAYFYGVTKKHTIQAYTTSKYYLTKVQVYELVPGRYHGCVPVKKIA